jgi:hypothetical protein
VKRRWLWFAVFALVLLSAVGAAAILEPNRIVLGWIAGEPFFRWRPASYWKKVLRADGEAGYPYRKASGEFSPKEVSLNVLLECARDPNPNVRRPALYVLAEGSVRLNAIRDALTEALADADPQVKLTSLVGLAGYGPRARSSVAAVVPLLQDPDVQVAFVANLALWDIDPAAARDATGWRQFTSDAWAFSVMLPSAPMESTVTAPGAFPSVNHMFLALEGGISQYGVTVLDYPEDVFFPPTDKERLDFGRDSTVAGFKAKGLTYKVADETPIEFGGRKGREFRVEVEEMGFVRSRIFWAGRRLYQVKVASQTRFLNAKAADFFMNSFRIMETAPAAPAQP